MNPTIERLKLIFLGIFAVANAGILVWTLGWAMPEQKCVEAHKWWDGSARVCAQPILTSDITGRMIVNRQAREEALRAIGRLPAAANSSAPKP
jgi:hypothetical protein